MLNLALAQFGNSYGGQQALPLSVGVLWAYAKPNLKSEFNKPTFLYKKESIQQSLAHLNPLPNILAFSLYIWNYNYSRTLAKAVKILSPTTIIVYGGVHIPDNPDGVWFDAHPEVDFLLHGEGELSFARFLEEYIGGEEGKRDWSRVPGLSYRGLRTERKFPTIDELRSPYLDGIFDKLLQQEGRWTGLQETNRGCPYFCSFCQWGASALNKIRPFPLDRVLNEIEWFGKNKISYIEGADANFGILPRDVQIAEALAKTKEKYGYPERYRAAFAKYSNKRIADQVFQIASILHKSNQLKAVTLALQSTDEGVLDAIERKNISMAGFADLQKKYNQDGIPTYVELILGLPNETYETFKTGLDKVLDAGSHWNISIYICVILPNSEMGNPDYLAKYKIQTVPMRAMLLHGIPNPDAPDEIQESVIATKSMPHEEWKKTYLLSWIIQTLHTTGLTQAWAKKEREDGLPYTRFYEQLLKLAQIYPESVLGKTFLYTSKLLQQAVEGGTWDNVLPVFGNISWPPDESGFLLIVLELAKFYQELEEWGMPKLFETYGPPRVPEGEEEEYGKVFWFNRKGDLLGSLRSRFSKEEGNVK